MDRREVLKSIVSAALAGAAASRPASAAPEPGGAALFFVPGAHPERARMGGLPLSQHPALRANLPQGYEGPLTLVARLDERDRSVKRALLPLSGHHIAIHPRGHQAFFCPNNAAQMVRFDPHSLALIDTIQPHAQGFMGGGHSSWTRNARTLVNTERRPYARFTGSPADHRGRIVIRDGQSMKVLEVYESYGIAPHDLTLMEDSGLIAVTNYGSTWQSNPADDAKNPLRYAEPRLALVDLASGRLVDRYAAPGDPCELRHLAVRDPDHLFVVGYDARPDADMAPLLARDQRIEPPDGYGSAEGMTLAPAPIYAVRRSGGATQGVPLMPQNALDFRQGQTIIYDPAYDEAIAAFATSGTLAVVDAKSFELKRLVRTDRFGLQFPRGLALHPDGRRYVVSGSWAGLYFLTRGSHEVDHAATWHEMFFHHSHITAVGIGRA